MSRIHINIDLLGVIWGFLTVLSNVHIICREKQDALMWASFVFLFLGIMYLVYKNIRNLREKKLPDQLSSKVKIPILIIDDDINHLLLMKGAFEGMEYDIAVSRSLDDIRLGESFAIIVSDIVNVSLTSSSVNNHSEEILEEIEKNHPYKRIIRVSSGFQSGTRRIIKGDKYEKEVKKEVDKIIQEMNAPQKYWDAVSCDLRSKGVEDKKIQEVRKRFIHFLRTKLE